MTLPHRSASERRALRVDDRRFEALVEEEGEDFLTVHGRTVEAQYSGETNLDLIRKVKENVEIPVVGNGDIVDGPSAERMLNYTKCDLIMIGRAAMENSRIFLEINKYLRRF